MFTLIWQPVWFEAVGAKDPPLTRMPVAPAARFALPARFWTAIPVGQLVKVRPTPGVAGTYIWPGEIGNRSVKPGVESDTATGFGFRISKTIRVAVPACTWGTPSTIGASGKLFVTVNGSTTRRLAVAESGAGPVCSVEIFVTLFGSKPAFVAFTTKVNSHLPLPATAGLKAFSEIPENVTEDAPGLALCVKPAQPLFPGFATPTI